MTYVKMIDEETGRELTEEDLKNYEWVETTVHSTALDTRTYIRGRQLPAPYMQHADPAPPTEQEVLRYFGVLGSEIIRHTLTWDILETESVNGYKGWTTGPTGKLVIQIRRKGE